MQVLVGYLSWLDTYYLIGICLGDGQRTNTIMTHVWKRLDYIFGFINNSIVNSEHSWEDLCMHSRFQQTCTPNKVEVWFSIQVLLCKSNQWRLENMKDKPNNNNIFYTIHLSYCTMLIEVAFMVCVVATRAICHLLELSPSPCKIIYMSVDE